ncbi:LamG domain-containing protein [Actomonas aquatica]|uniref:LamG-like jellyroll fold domain-containing protein n=1 Tax=Actomonas aquatica TaxID=2866162 RepID=A0ABZ1C6E8_9BACT|nr:LamG domain-containing protein [Opitutus sp. WL0086]WRQ86987.1 LamG-like jellyroll fold domain-containing protein [Opitutus sp. WL0086]
MNSFAAPRFVIPLFCLLTLTAPAQVVVHHFAGGEADTASAGDALSSTLIDSGATGTDLSEAGSGGTFSSNTRGSASSLSYQFDGSNYYSGALDTSLSSSASFGMEAWINASNTTTGQMIVYNGNSGTNGIGLYLNGNTIDVLRGGIALNPVGIIEAGSWHHVAVVWDNGALTGYLDGNANFSASSQSFDLVGGALLIAGNNASLELFQGFIDDVRIFTFETGTFDTSMLHLSTSAVPEPTTYATLLGLAGLGLALWCRRPAPTQAA